MRALIFVMMFFIISGLIILENNALALHKQESRAEFVQLYSNWIGKIFSNITNLTGNAVEMNWMPE